MHTPGPWVSDEMVHNMMEFRVYSSLGRVIVRVQDFTTFREDVEMAEANARLIAAAPELLQALKRITDQYKALLKDCGLSSKDVISSAESAIAKAEGKP